MPNPIRRVIIQVISFKTEVQKRFEWSPFVERHQTGYFLGRRSANDVSDALKSGET
jgi:hypothetical protein